MNCGCTKKTYEEEEEEVEKQKEKNEEKNEKKEAEKAEEKKEEEAEQEKEEEEDFKSEIEEEEEEEIREANDFYSALNTSTFSETQPPPPTPCPSIEPALQTLSSNSPCFAKNADQKQLSCVCADFLDMLRKICSVVNSSPDTAKCGKNAQTTEAKKCLPLPSPEESEEGEEMTEISNQSIHGSTIFDPAQVLECVYSYEEYSDQQTSNDENFECPRESNTAQQMMGVSGKAGVNVPCVCTISFPVPQYQPFVFPTTANISCSPPSRMASNTDSQLQRRSTTQSANTKCCCHNDKDQKSPKNSVNDFLSNSRDRKDEDRRRSSNSETFKTFIDSLSNDVKGIKDTLNRGISCMQKRNGGCLEIPDCKALSAKQPPPRLELSFPVTIESVRPLGRCSLLVYWCIHDLRGVGGYEISVDGCTTNRYYSSGHDSAVIYGVDICSKHMITLHAIPVIDPCKSTNKKEEKSVENSKTSLLPVRYSSSKEIKKPCSWSPSCYLYDPECLM